ncbi:hypothetical protein AJ80_06837 [Polytolypa hystricis UAMH7299]|uniref:Autophagy-related protein 17 n=1 Tax=Polytolypa hystricis (strain UAMH7299) TaxID=1447883 RepID=A0A2B7XSC2_POLH7|nr:hypothetical protein AJ80_06837 [Polytolypa hystricis UAMH7299]
MEATSPQSSTSSLADHAEEKELGTPMSPAKPDLEVLVSHLVAAKRSLSSINHVWRANEIVTTARSALEESVVISARSGFLRRGLHDQLLLLYNVRAEVEQIAHQGRNEFAAALRELDDVDERLKQTLNLLHETVVEPAFRSSGEEQKTLHDFVDERGVEDLQSSLKDAIDQTNAAQARLDESNLAFDQDLHSVQQTLGKYRKLTKSLRSSSSQMSTSSSSRDILLSPSLIPGLLRSLESHAQEMADLLESLVRHFDLCVTAVKHTEGGGAAAQSITGDLPTGVDLSVSIGQEVGSTNTDGVPQAPLEPLTDKEYQEMITVLVKDAAEADDVALEIQDRGSEMEAMLDQVLEQRDAIVAIYTSTTNIFHRLSNIANSQLPDYIAQAHAFTQTWKEQHERIQSGMTDLSDLSDLYAGFLHAYDGLILEVARRKAVRTAAEKVLRDARSKLDKLYEEDIRARETFRVEQGDYLPSDIWPGLGRGPMRVEFTRVEGPRLEGEVPTDSGDGEQDAENGDGDDDDDQPADTAGPSPTGEQQDKPSGDSGDSIPDLPKHIIERAFSRLKTRSRPGIPST